MGIEECETCDEYRIHKEEWNVHADINQKKRKMDAVMDTEVVCSTGCKKCEDFMDHILQRNRSRKDYEKDKDLTALDNNTCLVICRKLYCYLDFLDIKNQFSLPT